MSPQSAQAISLPSTWRQGMRPNEDGVYVGVSRENYDLIDRWNFSTVKHIKHSPAKLRSVKLDKAKEDTDALRVGRAGHVATLEPERFRASHVVWDGGRRYGKEWDKFQEKNAGLEILTEDQYQQVRAVADAASANEHAAKYLRNGHAEVTLLWTHREPANGVPGFEIACKGRIDFGVDAGVIVDLKTARDASPEGFARAAWNLDYLTQAAFYVDGYAAAHKCAPPEYRIIAVEKDAPYVVQVYRVPPALLALGRDNYRTWLHRLNQCLTTNHWPGFADGELDLELPRWMRSDNDVSGLGLEFPEEQSA